MAQSTTLYRGSTSMSVSGYWGDATLFTLGAAPAKIIISRMIFYVPSGSLFAFSGGAMVLYITSTNGNEFPIAWAPVVSSGSGYLTCALVPSEQNNGMQSTVWSGGTLNTSSGQAFSVGGSEPTFDTNTVLSSQQVYTSQSAPMLPKIFWMGPGDSLKGMIYAGATTTVNVEYLFVAISET